MRAIADRADNYLILPSRRRGGALGDRRVEAQAWLASIVGRLRRRSDSWGVLEIRPALLQQID